MQSVELPLLGILSSPGVSVSVMTNSMNPSAMKLFLKDHKKAGGVKVRRLNDT